MSVGFVLSSAGYIAKFFKKSSANHNIVLTYLKKRHGVDLL
jgi:hypothetical protein